MASESSSKPGEGEGNVAADGAEKSPADSSRARAGKAGKKKRSVAKAPPAERVAEIRRLMSDGRYEGAATRLELSEKYGVGEAAIMRDAAEAHRLLSSDPEDAIRQKASLAAFCARMREQAAGDRNNVTGLADVSAALKAAELQAKFLSIEIDGTKRLEVAGKGGGPIAISLAEVSEALDAAQSNTSDGSDKSDAGSEEGDPSGVR